MDVVTGERKRPTGLARSLILAEWPPSPNRLLTVSVGLCVAVAVLDVVTGTQVNLIGMLVIGPCLAVAGGRWTRTAIVGACAVGLAVLLGFPDGIWGTATQVEFVGAILFAALATTLVAALIEFNTPLIDHPAVAEALRGMKPGYLVVITWRPQLGGGGVATLDYDDGSTESVEMSRPDALRIADGVFGADQRQWHSPEATRWIRTPPTDRAVVEP